MRFIALASAVVLASLATPTIASDRPQAETAAQCASASRAFSKMRYDEAVANWRKVFANNPTMFKARKQESRKKWIVDRYNHNVSKCRAWFEGGKTIPYTPS